MFYFEEKAIKRQNKICYNFDNVKTTVKVNDDSVYLIREGTDFINSFSFNKKKSDCNYYLRDNNCSVDIEIKTKLIEITNSNICIKYIVIDSGIEYEYMLEMSDE